MARRPTLLFSWWPSRTPPPFSFFTCACSPRGPAQHCGPFSALLGPRPHSAPFRCCDAGPLISAHPHVLPFSPLRRWPRLSAARTPVVPFFPFLPRFLSFLAARRWHCLARQATVPSLLQGKCSITTPLHPFLLRRARPAYKAPSRTPPSPLSSARVQALPAAGNPPLPSSIPITDVSQSSAVFPRSRRYH